MTKREFYEVIANKGIVTDEMVEMATKYIDQLDTRNANRKPSKNQLANEELKTEILGVLSTTGMTVTEVLKALDKAELSNQKVSALMKQLVETNKVIKTVDKRKSYFSIA